MRAINEIPTPSNMLGVTKIDTGNDLSFDGTQVPYWLGGSQGAVEQAVTSVGPVYVPANTPANNAGQNMGGPAIVADPTLEDFFNPYSPLFFSSVPDLPTVPAKKKSNTVLYIGAGLLAYLLFA